VGWLVLIVGIAAAATTATTTATTTTTPEKASTYRTLKVAVIHRHGDRTPITPLKDEEYWAAQLIDPSTLQKLAENTSLIRNNNDNKKQPQFTHGASGKGPFGQLTRLGLLQMIQVGQTLRDELTGSSSSSSEDNNTNRLFYTPLFTDNPSHQLEQNSQPEAPRPPLHPKYMRVFSTDFPRTITSVQGVLVGLFPDGNPTTIPIDVRNTELMIPDPMPRRTVEQTRLEQYLVQRPHVVQRERDHIHLAIKATHAIHDLLGPTAHEVSFGVSQHKEKVYQTKQTEASKENDYDSYDDNDENSLLTSIEIEPLQWNQLAEITVCLAARDQLPSA
jgi:acid phosphatase